MSKRIGNVSIIAEEPEMVCFLCGKIDEVRPYGPNGEEICYDCGMKNERETNIQMNIRLFGQTREEAEKRADDPDKPTMAEAAKGILPEPATEQ